ncbi:sensor histidine kinase [Cellulomonas chengniuliangii]|uniref:histidine kinase n=1 Tax=Cellulomonas chengniuliangii TaxID=2968084 RepID=A0ABY5KVK3_9CELL|nr:sensor histidine kinase [Cellulomonas chengniuliangii]MCC2310054.1 sensor histidine kinase [Cellulomonas chengniuliangii]UUI74551.1 sensor histidine kinase [Cellulomonas chengniuliangii]
MGLWERWNRWEDSHRFAIDATLTGLVMLVAVPLSAASADSFYPVPFDLYLWSAAVIAPLAWRRSHPAASAAVVFVVGLLQVLAGHSLILPADLAVLAALYSVTVHGPRWAHRVAITGALLGSLLMSAAFSGNDPVSLIGTTLFASSVALAVWAFGLVRRQRRLTIDALVDRTHRLEVERDQQARLATAAERSRIAREMHDIVAHSLSVIIAQADGGRYAAEADPAAATRSLGTISETGRAALADMRRLLGVLRTDPADAARPRTPGLVAAAGHQDTDASGATTSPMPAAHDLDSLVEQVRASGLRVSLVRMGTPRPLPPGAGLTVYRICQESLTNVLKHAGPDPAVTVLVQWQAAAIQLEVSDDGRGASAESDGLGQGLLGMRERAAMFGGSVKVGPRPGGGFRVRAQLPLPPVANDDAPAMPAPSEPVESVDSSSTPPPLDDPATGSHTTHRERPPMNHRQQA